MAKKATQRRNGKSDGSASRIPSELVDELMKHYERPEDLTGPGGLLKELTAALVNRAMDAELDSHLGYPAGATPPRGEENRRNGRRSKTVRSEQGPLQVEVPRDRAGTFEPKIIPKHKRHFDGFDDKILSMYGRGMTVREIRAHLEEIYGVDVSSSLISEVTDAIVQELEEWQKRPLDTVYPIVYVDALVAKIRSDGVVQNKSIYLAMGVSTLGEKSILGMWIEKTEGASFWASILTELRQRGVEDIFILCADGLVGLPSAVEAVFPKAIFQTCIVHVIRASTRFVPWKERRAVCADLRQIYTAPDEDSARSALERFEETWGAKFPMIARAWRDRWEEITPFLHFPPEIRRAIYTTNALESCNRQIRKVLKTRGHMPNDAATLKLVFLAIKNAHKRMKPPAFWTSVRLQLSIYFQDRFPLGT